MMINGDSRHMI